MKFISLAAPVLAGVTGLVLSAGPAAAQPPPPPPPGQYDWTGLYLGLNTGWNGADTHVDSSALTVNQLSGLSNGSTTVAVPATTVGVPPMGFRTSGWAVGGQVGYNKQYGHLVFGLEGDMDAVTGSTGRAVFLALPPTALTTGATLGVARFTDPQWTASVRGRLGWAMGPAMLYGTGGLAIADVRQVARYSYAPTVTGAVAAANPNAFFGPFFAGSGQDSTLTGWTVGGGGEYALNRQLSVGLEYRYSDYGHRTIGFGSPNAAFEFPRVGFTDNQVLAKINFRFGPGIF